MYAGKMLRALILVMAVFLAQGKTAYAHERWFVTEGRHAAERHSLDWTNLLVIFGAVLLVAAAVIVHRSVWSRKLQVLSERAQRSLPGGIEWRVVAFLTGMVMIANSLTGVFLANNLMLQDPSLLMLGAVTQALIGMLLISQISFLLPGLLMLGFALPLAAIQFSPVLMADYIVEFVALGLAFTFFGIGSVRLDRLLSKRLKLNISRYSHLPLPIIRIGMGLTLAVLALSNKLLSPDMALTFLDKHDFNFLQTLGFTGFTNLHFVFAAGVTEVALGLLLVFGIATRFVASAMAALLLTTMAILGPVELAGHLPLLGITAVLIFKGPGRLRLSGAAARTVPEARNAGAVAQAQ